MGAASPGKHSGKKFYSKRVRERGRQTRNIGRERGENRERGVSLCLSVSPSLSLSLSLSLYLFVSVYLSVSLSPLCLSLTLCHPVYLFLFLSVCMSVSLSLLVILKRNVFSHLHLLFFVTILLFRRRNGKRNKHFYPFFF